MWWKKRIYLDTAAGAAGNSSSSHQEGRSAKSKLEEARVAIARLVEVKADDIVFTSGATEANALAILGLARPGAHFLYLPSAHASLVENVLLAQKRYGVRAEPLVVKDGKVDIEALKQQLRPETELVSMEAVCGETGTIWNTHEVAGVLREGGRLHVDASQAPFTEKLIRAHYGADLLVLDGAKVGAPGAGCLIAHRTISLRPLYDGGGQERGLRSGTQNVAAIEIFARELAKLAAERERFTAKAREQRAALLKALEGIKDIHINVGREGVPQIVNISLPGRDTDYVVALLDEAGFALSTKSACESGNGEGSRAVLALSGDPARAISTLRISWGPTTSSRDLSRFVAALKGAIHFVDTASRA